MSKVSIEVATADLNRWLDKKKVSDAIREKQQVVIDELADAIACGLLTVSENCELEYKLSEPVTDSDGNISVGSLKFKNRLRVDEVMSRLKGLDPKDVDGRMMAYVGALTGVATGLLKKMDTDDYKIPQSIAVFFM